MDVPSPHHRHVMHRNPLILEKKTPRHPPDGCLPLNPEACIRCVHPAPTAPHLGGKGKGLPAGGISCPKANSMATVT